MGGAHQQAGAPADGPRELRVGLVLRLGEGPDARAALTCPPRRAAAPVPAGSG